MKTATSKINNRSPVATNEVLLTDNGIRMIQFLQSHDKVWVGKELGEALGIKGVYSVINSLTSNSLVEYVGTIDREFINNKGIKLIKSYKAYQLTNQGRLFEIKNIQERK